MKGPVTGDLQVGPLIIQKQHPRVIRSPVTPGDRAGRNRHGVGQGGVDGPHRQHPAEITALIVLDRNLDIAGLADVRSRDRGIVGVHGRGVGIGVGASGVVVIAVVIRHLQGRGH